MNERDKTFQMMQESSGQLLWGTESHFQQFADRIRADAMETATRAANESWTLLAKALVLAEREACVKMVENLCDQKFADLIRADEREACAKVVDHMASRCNDIRAAALESAAENIRARGNI